MNCETRYYLPEGATTLSTQGVVVLPRPCCDLRGEDAMGKFRVRRPVGTDSPIRPE
jgi:hypothetical protein